MKVSYHPLSFVSLFLLELYNCEEVLPHLWQVTCVNCLLLPAKDQSLLPVKQACMRWIFEFAEFILRTEKERFPSSLLLPSAQISFSGTICLGMYFLPSSSPFPPRAQTHNKALPGWLAVSWDGHLVTAWKELLKLQTAGWRGLAKQEIGLSVSAQSRGGRLCLFVQRKIEKGNHSLIPVSTSK